LSEARQPNVVTVTIAGDDYAIRAHATPEYTRECAAFVDRTIAEILRGGSLVQPHKAAILAGLAITDQLYQARREADALRAEVSRLSSRLASDIEARLRASDLAAGS
jgi:cell division protein ZapA (FtsZ GTPase activity inhibitor)